MNISDHLAKFEHDIVLDALRTATAAYWLRRADEFDAAKPRPEEYRGAADRNALSAAWRRCDDAARACRARAKVAPFEDLGHEIVAQLGEAA